MSLHFEWYGDRVVAEAEHAAGEETTATVDRAVIDARENTPVLTGRAQNSLTRENEGMDVTWGYHVDYGIWIEVGARGRAGVLAMRRAADRAYAHLAGRMARRLGW